MNDLAPLVSALESPAPPPVEAPTRPAPPSAEALTRAWIAAHQPVTQEVQTRLPITEGALPDGLRGVLYRNGPGRFGVGEQLYGHPFDGDGMVLRFALGACSTDSTPSIRYRNRYVRTAEFIAEERAGRILYRGFGTNRPGGMASNVLRLRFKNAANTNVVYFGGRLMTLWEAGLPHVLDPFTLDTLERADFGGVLRNRGGLIDRVLSPELPFSAHPKIDEQASELYNFGLVMGVQHRLLVYTQPAGGELRVLREVPLETLSFVHDFVLTPRWLVFFLYPVAFDMSRTLLGLSTAVGSLRPLPDEPTQVLLVPRDGGEPRWLTAAPCFVFHFVNAFEDARGRIVVDACRNQSYPDLPPMPELLAGNLPDYPAAHLTRFVLDPEVASPSQDAALSSGPGPGSGGVTEERLSPLACELPRVHPALTGRPHRFVYAIGAVPQTPHNLYTAVMRFDTERRESRMHDFAPGLPGEPVFVPRPGGTDEDDGWVLSVVYQAAEHRSALYVLDGRDLSTVCVAPLPHHVPPGFHGSFVPAADCPPGWQA